jgi:hypothetical protein
MTEHVPLDHLVLNLLALVEAAPELPPETLARLADLATTVEPTVESLAAISLRIKLELMRQPAFSTASRAWDMLAPPERYGLSLDEVGKTLPNPEASLASGIEALQQTVTVILQNPQEAAHSPTRLQWLAGLVKQFWPRQRSEPPTHQEPAQPEGAQP